jgi:hypothetical protein
MTEVTRYTFHCASNQRNSGTNTDLNLTLAEIITKKAANSSFYVMCHGITVPFSFYQLSADIATLYVTITGEASPLPITLAVGNYTTLSLLQELSAKLVALCESRPIPFTPVFNFSYAQISGRMTFAMTSPTMKTFILNFNTNPTLGIFFGCSENIGFSTATSAQSQQIAVANPVTQLFLRSPSFNQSNNREWLVEKDTFCDIIYRIPINTNAGTYIQVLGDSEEILLSNDTFSVINLYLTTNLSYNPIDLQGLPFTVHFTLIERIHLPYTPIGSQLAGNFPVPVVDTVELERLQKEREDAIRRLETYKEKLTKPKTKERTS